ncbi:MAG: IMPACT family protein [Bacilli bacterium]
MFSIRDNDKFEMVIKNSKFISLIFRVYSKDDVNNILNSVKNEYQGATHYCYGYVIDSDIRANDDNEPSGTAGYPILNQITSNNLNYTLIVVVRYFGGIKLGAGPLTRAYAKVARNVINSNNIVMLEKGYDISINFNYNDIKDIDYILGNCKIINKSFDNDITYNVYVNNDTLNKLSKYNVTVNKEIYIEKE